MPFISVSEAVKAAPSTFGFTAATRPASKATPNKFVVLLTINAAAQRQLFARPVKVDEDRFTITRGDGAESGLVQIVLDPDGQFKASASIKGSIRFRFHAWAGCPREARKAMGCKLVEKVGMQATVALPWRGENRA